MSAEPSSTQRPALPPGFRLAALETVDSTNAEALRRAEAGAPDGTFVWARRQEAGRGRQAKPWSSPAGNLYTSLLLRPACAPARAAELSFVAAVAVADTVADLLGPAGPAVSCKWPNDVLVDGAKISGILLESRTQIYQINT